MVPGGRAGGNNPDSSHAMTGAPETITSEGSVTLQGLGARPVLLCAPQNKMKTEDTLS